jgi:arylsulfatase A-like enzyme
MSVSSSASRPHVLFVICDELRADTLGFAGDDVVKTPHLNALAADSVRFTQSYCASPMCVPSRASLATGRHAACHGAFDNGMRPCAGETSLYASFRDGGYGTFTTGKWHTNADAKLWGWQKNLSDPGFPAKAITCFGTTDDELRKKGKTFKNEGLLSLVMHGINPLEPDQTMDSIFTSHLLQHLKSMDGEKPQFMRLSLLDPHSPYQPTQKYRKQVDGGAVSFPPHLHPDYSEKPLLQEFFYRSRGFHHLREEDYRESKACYYSLIQHNDDRIGQVIQTLKDNGLYDDMLIVFTSDHGAMMGEQGCLEKWGHLYEQVVKTPLLLKFPKGQWAGRCLDDFVENVDIMPTLLEACGLPIPEGIHGKSLMPRLRDEVECHRSDAISCYMSTGLMDAPAWMIRFGHWKATFYPDSEVLKRNLPGDHHLRHTHVLDREAPRGELYHLELDPYEQNNLFCSLEHESVLREARQRLDERLGAMADRLDLSQIQRHDGNWCDFRLLLEGSYRDVGAAAFSEHAQSGGLQLHKS